jgi:hypothetical protein
MNKRKDPTPTALENRLFLQREELFAQRHRNDTDEELLQYLRDMAKEQGRTPRKHDVPGFTYVKSRFGPWPRVLEKAGLKEIKEKKSRRKDRKKRK